jgi:hypothetical protein
VQQIIDQFGHAFWEAPKEARSIISIAVTEEYLHVECENGLYEILPDGSWVGIKFN